MAVRSLDDAIDALCAPAQDEGARIEHLYGNYRTELCRYVRATFGAGPPDPEDVAQSAFARFMALREPERVTNPRAFLYATARNIVLDFNRHLKLVRRHASDAVEDHSSVRADELSPERIALAQERASLLSEAIRTLPARQRQALILHRLHDLSYSEIAARLGSSKSDVKRQIERAMAAIEASLEASD